jgi:hypothetical protein
MTLKADAGIFLPGKEVKNLSVTALRSRDSIRRKY